MTIGQRIKSRRLELKWSMRELSKRIGYADHSTIAKIEADKVDLTQSRVVQFSEVLGVSIAYLMGWEEVQKKNDTLSDIVVRMRSDENFLSIVEKINGLDPEQLESVDGLLNAFLK